MKNSLQEIFDKAKTARAKDLPYSKEELRSIIEERRGAELRRKFQYLFKPKWRWKMLALSSSVIGLLFLVYSSLLNGISTENNTTQSADAGSKNAGNIVAGNLEEEMKSDFSESISGNDYEITSEEPLAEADQSGENGIRLDTMKSEDFQWNHLKYDRVNNLFYGIEKIVEKRDKEGKPSKVIDLYHRVDFKDLVRIHNELLDEFKEIGLNDLESIGYLEEPEFYTELKNLIEKGKAIKALEEAEKKLSIFGWLARKLANKISSFNYMELSIEELRELNIIATDTAYIFEKEEIVENPLTEMKKLYNEHNYPVESNNPFLVKYKGVIRWWINNSALNRHICTYSSRKLENIEEHYISINDAEIMRNYEGWDLGSYMKTTPVAVSSEMSRALIDYSPNVLDSKDKMNGYFIMQNSIDSIRRIKETTEDENVKKELNLEIMKLYTENELAKMDLLTNYLIPLKLDAPLYPIANDTNQQTSMYMWFVPNEAFLAALPDRYEIPLRKEIRALQLVQEGKMDKEEACKGLEEQEKFYDICRMSSNEISEVKIYPNPAKINSLATVEFGLTNDTYVNIALHDVNGRFIKTVLDWSKQTAGLKEFMIDLRNIPSGFYTAIINTEDGGQVTKRIIAR